MKWMSIRDINMLVKKGLYKLETGATENLIYDKQSGKYVGHIDSGGSFKQDSKYVPTPFIVKTIDNEVKGNWNDNSKWSGKSPW